MRDYTWSQLHPLASRADVQIVRGEAAYMAASALWTWTEHKAVCQWCGDAFRASAEAINDTREISGYKGTDAEIVGGFDCCLQCSFGVKVEGEKDGLTDA